MACFADARPACLLRRTEQYGEVTVRKGMEVVRMTVRGEVISQPASQPCLWRRFASFHRLPSGALPNLQFMRSCVVN